MPDETVWGGDFEVGPYPVGFRTQDIVRDVGDGKSRRLTLSVWYPASPTRADAAPMIFEDLYPVVLDEDQLFETRGLSMERAALPPR